MRQAINNLQSTHTGFGFVSAENVFKVCDQPHPVTVQAIIRACQKGDIDGAMEKLGELWHQGYSAVDIVVTVFRVVKTFDELPEYMKLEFIKVRPLPEPRCTAVHDLAGNRFHTYAYTGGCRHVPTAQWAHGSFMQAGTFNSHDLDHLLLRAI